MKPISRRNVLKLTSAGALGSLLLSESAHAATEHASVPLWDAFETTLQGPATGNPFVDVQLSAVFTQGHRAVEVEGFYDGAGQYKLRYMPDTLGEWSFQTASNIAALSGHTGRFQCTAAKPGVHGPVTVRNTRHFAYADGTAYFPFGTTCYAWVHQPEPLQQETLATLKNSAFNKIRMCVFPKHYEYNHNEPALYPFERDAAGKSDFTRPNPAFYHHLESRLADLRALNIEADLILFHPYDRWGYATMSAEQDDRYLRYVLARLSSVSNIWWSMANEYDLMKAKTKQDFDRLFHIVEQYDPSSHLRSIHYSNVAYNYAHPWVTHASLQTAQFTSSAGELQSWKKPVLFDEVQYEGNLNRRWGNISGEELIYRIWRGVIAGGYVTHGETLLSATDTLDEETTPTLWWSHGGKLRGNSPERIGFLRKLLEDSVPATGPDHLHTGLTAAEAPYYTNAFALESDGKTVSTILYFLDTHQPIWYEFPLPDGTFQAELIDPWSMTFTAVPGTLSGKARIKLTAKPYQALRFRRVT